MNDSVFRLYDQFLREFTPLADAVPADRMDVCPYEGGHDARWVMGHLAVGLDFAGSLLGLEHSVPPTWGKLFGPGSSGRCDPNGPSKAELVEAVQSLHAKVGAAMRAASPEAMAKPHGFEFLPKDSPLATKGDFIGYLVTTHAFYHLAQLSACKTVLR
jgi:hypothetical protein